MKKATRLPGQHYHQLHYRNIAGLLVRRDGLLAWRCPDCEHTGHSREVLAVCPKCKGKQKAKPR